MPIDTDSVAREDGPFEELVFVGGPADGKRLLVRVGDPVYNYYSTELGIEHGLPGPRVDLYKRTSFVIFDSRNISHNVDFMRDASLDDFGVMRRLLLGYQRKPRATRPPTGNVQVTDRRAQFGAMFGMGQRRQEEMSQRPHPHTSVEVGTGITYQMLVSSLRRLEEDYLRSPWEETSETNECAEAAGLNMEDQS